MTYVVSNLHGEYDKFRKLLEEIHFSDSDIMYLLGDLVDYGDQSMELIADLSVRTNIYPVAGEHDFLAAKMLAEVDRTLGGGTMPEPERVAEMTAWVQDGGEKTLAGFRALDEEQREGVLDYLGDLALFEEAEVNGKQYLMVHAGIADFDPDADLDDYEPEDFFSEPLSANVKLLPDTTVIVGHIPTESGRITYGNGSIFVDCGVENGGSLGCLRLEDGKEFYI